MKRVLVVLLSLAYLVASSGFTLRQHYCMGQLIGTAIDQPGHYAETRSCKKCGMEKKNGDNDCCKDKVKTFKASPDQMPAKAFHFSCFSSAAMPAPSYFFALGASYADASHMVAAPVHGPPGIPSVPIFLRVRSLLI